VVFRKNSPIVIIPNALYILNSRYTRRHRAGEYYYFMIKTLLKIITAPIWLPIKLLWFTSKLIAFIFLLLIIAAGVYLYFTFR